MGADAALYAVTDGRRLCRLGKLKELFETGQLRAVIDREYSMAKIRDAHAYVEHGYSQKSKWSYTEMMRTHIWSRVRSAAMSCY